jgi:hypothetical protein
LHDGIEIERRGKPAAVVCSDKFVVTAKAQAETCGMPDYPFAVVPHPIGRLPDEVLRERVATAVPQVIELLVQGKKPG